MPKTFYIIDGYAQVFRAYYAIRTPMVSPSTGEPTNAVFGFTGMLLKLLSKFQPDYAAVAIDAPGKTFRDDLYREYMRLHPSNALLSGVRMEPESDVSPLMPSLAEPDDEPQPEKTTARFTEYKGTRQATPDALNAQIDRIFQVIDTFGIPMFAQRGLEADDVIATLVQQILDDPACSDVHIRIVSKDKDLEQLLCERVSIFDVHTDVERNVAQLLADKGITPAQVIDVMALVGDSVDNIPGVEGIGLKTAAQLVQKYGNVESLLQNLDSIKGKRRENLEKARDFLPLSKTLVTLKRDADLPFALESSRVVTPNLEKLLPLFQELGFNRYQDEARRLAQNGSEAKPTAEAKSETGK